MDICITPGGNRNKSKVYYSLEWGKQAGQQNHRTKITVPFKLIGAPAELFPLII
jgi:hypothetical protein